MRISFIFISFIFFFCANSFVYGQTANSPNTIKPMPLEKPQPIGQSWGSNPNNTAPVPKKYYTTNQANGIKTGFNGYFLSMGVGYLYEPQKILNNNIYLDVGHGQRATLAAGLVYKMPNSYFEFGPEIARARLTSEYFVKSTGVSSFYSTQIFSFGIGMNYIWNYDKIAPFTGFTIGRAKVSDDKKISGIYVRNNDDTNQFHVKTGLKIELGDYGHGIVQYQGGWYDNVLERNSMIHGLEIGYNILF